MSGFQPAPPTSPHSSDVISGAGGSGLSAAEEVTDAEAGQSLDGAWSQDGGSGESGRWVFRRYHQKSAMFVHRFRGDEFPPQDPQTVTSCFPLFNMVIKNNGSLTQVGRFITNVQKFNVYYFQVFYTFLSWPKIIIEQRFQTLGSNNLYFEIWFPIFPPFWVILGIFSKKKMQKTPKTLFSFGVERPKSNWSYNT